MALLSMPAICLSRPVSKRKSLNWSSFTQKQHNTYMILVIAEKPSVGASIAKVFGAASRRDGYLEGNNCNVSWCVGHLVGLAMQAPMMSGLPSGGTVLFPLSRRIGCLKYFPDQPIPPKKIPRMYTPRATPQNTYRVMGSNQRPRRRFRPSCTASLANFFPQIQNMVIPASRAPRGIT